MTRAAVEDTARRAVVVSRRPLFFSDGGDAAQDRTAHVRAASGLTWLTLDGAPRLLVAQDDTSFLAVIDPHAADPVVQALTLPHSVAGRRVFETRLGNKQQKLDLEACTTATWGGHERALIFGSGSTAARERIVCVEPSGITQLLDAAGLYAALREAGVGGSELNIEGAAAIGDRLLLLQRGNGAARDGRVPQDASCTLSIRALHAHLLEGAPPPAIDEVTVHELGAIDGVKLTFTDVTVSGDQLAFLAGAEASPNTVDDGEVVGAALGTMTHDARDVRWTRLTLEDGTPYRGKVEGLAPRDPQRADGRFWAVLDADDPDRAAELLDLVLG